MIDHPCQAGCVSQMLDDDMSAAPGILAPTSIAKAVAFTTASGVCVAPSLPTVTFRPWLVLVAGDPVITFHLTHFCSSSAAA